MNEKIKELAEQSGIKFTPFTVDGEEYDFDEVEVEDSDMLQNFAELIVNECLRVVYDDGSMPLSVSLAVKEHFGLDYV